MKNHIWMLLCDSNCEGPTLFDFSQSKSILRTLIETFVMTIALPFIIFFGAIGLAFYYLCYKTKHPEDDSTLRELHAVA